VVGRAGALEDGAAVGGIGFGERFVGEEAFEFRHVGILVPGGLGDGAPEINEAGPEDALELAGGEGGNVGLGDFLFL
jgi:hypothetical protein